MGELTGAVASVQFKKLAQIIRHMQGSKRRIKALLKGVPGLSFRRPNDEAGDTGSFLILLLESEAKAGRVAERMRAAGLSGAVRLAEYGLHVYSNVPQLVGKIPLSSAGNPWALAQNLGSAREYGIGACPRSDALFGRSILLPIPSNLTAARETAAARIIKSAME